MCFLRLIICILPSSLPSLVVMSQLLLYAFRGSCAIYFPARDCLDYFQVYEVHYDPEKFLAGRDIDNRMKKFLQVCTVSSLPMSIKQAQFYAKNSWVAGFYSILP